MKREKRRLTNRSEVSFGLVENVLVDYFSITEIDNIEDRTGLYSWSYLPKNLDRSADSFVNLRSLNTTVTGNFGMTYSGDIKRESGLASKDLGLVEGNLEGFRQVLIAFSAPLYIGISKTLKSRLLIHRRQLEKYMDNPSSYVNEDSGYNFDSPEESSYFAFRVGCALKEHDIDSDSLFVKCTYINDYEAVKSIEKVANRILAPTYGRR